MVSARRKWNFAVALGDQQTRQTKGEDSQSSVVVECGEQAQFESNENH